MTSRSTGLSIVLPSLLLIPNGTIGEGNKNGPRPMLGTRGPEAPAVPPCLTAAASRSLLLPSPFRPSPPELRSAHSPPPPRQARALPGSLSDRPAATLLRHRPMADCLAYTSSIPQPCGFDKPLGRICAPSWDVTVAPPRHGAKIQ